VLGNEIGAVGREGCLECSRLLSRVPRSLRTAQAQKPEALQAWAGQGWATVSSGSFPSKPGKRT
jgi:hypothetical protein